MFYVEAGLAYHLNNLKKCFAATERRSLSIICGQVDLG